jgi:ribonucleotide monophosphatase NagD (HAD superfamily)
MVEALLERQVDAVAGKPATLLLEMLAAENNLHCDEIAVVGDSVESDGRAAEKFGAPWFLYEPTGIGHGGLATLRELNDLIGYLEP